MIQQTMRLRYKSKSLNKTCDILLEKGGQPDFSLVKLYKVISLLI